MIFTKAVTSGLRMLAGLAVILALMELKGTPGLAAGGLFLYWMRTEKSD